MSLLEKFFIRMLGVLLFVTMKTIEPNLVIQDWYSLDTFFLVIFVVPISKHGILCTYYFFPISNHESNGISSKSLSN